MDLLPRKANELLEVTQPVGSHFLDSGAFTLRTHAIRWGKKHKRPHLEFFDTPEFWKYLTSYAQFVKEHHRCIDLYANIDVIDDPALSLRNLRELQKLGCTPVPVVHNGNDYSYLINYIKQGHPVIGLGGLAGRKRGDGSLKWVDGAFNIICSTKHGTPQVKIHGFGIGEFHALYNYPWYSVDNAGWSSSAAYGSIQVPRFRGGRFIFSEKPYTVVVSDESPEIKAGGDHHYLKMNKSEAAIVHKWLDFANIPLGTGDRNSDDLGVTNYHTYRRLSNMIYYFHLAKELPEWNRRFNGMPRPKLFGEASDNFQKARSLQDRGRTKFYYSGLSARGAFPEDVMSESNLMLTFFNCYKPILDKPHTDEPVEHWPLEKRFERVWTARIEDFINNG